MTQAAVYTPSAEVQRKKTALLEMRSEWRIVRCQSMRRVVMPNEDRSRVYRVDPQGRACNCDAGRHGQLCAHRLAIIEANHRDALTAWVDDQDRATGVASEAEVDLLCAEIAGRLRGSGAGAPILKTYESIWGAED